MFGSLMMLNQDLLKIYLKYFIQIFFIFISIIIYIYLILILEPAQLGSLDLFNDFTSNNQQLFSFGFRQSIIQKLKVANHIFQLL